MENLKQHLTRTLKNADEVYISQGDILISLNGFIDNRTQPNDESNMKVVKPISYTKGFYCYVCPDCCKLHFSGNLGKIQTGCCTDIDCERVQQLNEKHHLIKREPIILDDGF